ncbi:MAG TPA: NAD(P)H-dependent oxidoreductase [Solirubrobacteraceae bacterium]|nr:NAD(P)H-dependent oxidoreductase [Solirubrobacteraceae bacterium]
MLAIAGSLRPGSYNRMLLDAAARLLPEDVEIEIWDALAEIPAYGQHLDGPLAPALVHALRDAIAAADALLIAIAEYNASLPGALKNALDWASRPYPDNALRGKPAAVIGASTGPFGAVWAQAEVRKVLRTSGARVLDDDLPVGQAHDAFDAGRRLVDEDLSARLAALLTALVAEAGALIACAT